MTQANVDESSSPTTRRSRRLLGVEGDFGTGLGLTSDWAYRIIKHTLAKRAKFVRAQRRPGFADSNTPPRPDPPLELRAACTGPPPMR